MSLLTVCLYTGSYHLQDPHEMRFNGEAMICTYPSRDLQLKSNEVHVWCARLDCLRVQLHDTVKLLSEEERIRAGGYHFDRDRHHFLFRRGLLRMLLAGYLKVANPKQLLYEKNSYGKPSLVQSAFETPLFFSMSHSNDLTLFAFSWNREIGIDVEYVRAIEDIDGLVHRFFSSPECSEYGLLPLEDRSLAFFRAWTCKEAFLKGIGKGLSSGMDDFQVEMDPRKQACIRSVGLGSTKAEDWSLVAWEPAPCYHAAIAAESKGEQIESRILNLI